MSFQHVLRITDICTVLKVMNTSQWQRHVPADITFRVHSFLQITLASFNIKHQINEYICMNYLPNVNQQMTPNQQTRSWHVRFFSATKPIRLSTCWNNVWINILLSISNALNSRVHPHPRPDYLPSPYMYTAASITVNVIEESTLANHGQINRSRCLALQIEIIRMKQSRLWKRSMVHTSAYFLQLVAIYSHTFVLIACFRSIDGRKSPLIIPWQTNPRRWALIGVKGIVGIRAFPDAGLTVDVWCELRW